MNESKIKGGWFTFSMIWRVALAGIIITAVEVLIVVCLGGKGFPTDYAMLYAFYLLPLIAACYLLISIAFRKRFRFSLKSLLIWFTLIACGLGVCRHQLREIREEHTACAELTRDYYAHRAQITYGPRIIPRWLQGFSEGYELRARHAKALEFSPKGRGDARDLEILQLVAHLHWLERLKLSAPRMDVESLEMLAGCHSLRSLTLLEVSESAEGLKILSDLRGLTELVLDSTEIEDDDIQIIKKFTRLEMLTLDGSGITDAGLLELRTLRRLKRLSVCDTLVTPEGIAKLKKEIPGLTIVRTDYFPREQRLAFAEIRRLGGDVGMRGGPGQPDMLEDGGVVFDSISLYGGRNGGTITDDHLLLLRKFPDITGLYLDSNRLVTGEGLVHLRGLERLVEVSLGNTGVYGPGLAILSELPDLKYLDLSRTDLADEDIQHLKILSALEQLDLRGTMLSEEALEQLRDSLPDCEILTGEADY